MPTIGPLHHHKPGTEAGRLACSEQRSICLSVSTTHASFAGEVQWNVSRLFGATSRRNAGGEVGSERREKLQSVIVMRALPGVFATIIIKEFAGLSWPGDA